MLQRLGEHIANALQRAVAAEQRAADAADPELRLDNERMAQHWRLLARSLQFVESLERFLIEQERDRDARPRPSDRIASKQGCRKCGQPMALIYSVPETDGMPAVEAFRCIVCNETTTEAIDRSSE